MNAFQKLVLTLLFFPHPLLANKLVLDDTKVRQLMSQSKSSVFYSFSYKMPLSIDGLNEIYKATNKVDIPLYYIAENVESLNKASQEFSHIKPGQNSWILGGTVLKKGGADLHFPTILITKNMALKSSVPGYKSFAGYVSIISSNLRMETSSPFAVEKHISLPRPMSYFFKPVYGTSLILSGNAVPNYLFDIQNENLLINIDHFHWGDPGTTPDGKFITLLSDVYGLTWFLISDLLNGSINPLYNDPGLRTYQSMGKLPSNTNKSIYRVIGAISDSHNPQGLKFRDYRSVGNSVDPVGNWKRICVGKDISIPMMSKSGLYLSGRERGTLKVYYLGLDGKSCDEVFDTNKLTGKADFDIADKRILFISNDEDGVGNVFLSNIESGETQSIFKASPGDHVLSFPSFISERRIVVYDNTANELIVLTRN